MMLNYIQDKKLYHVLGIWKDHNENIMFLE